MLGYVLYEDCLGLVEELLGDVLHPRRAVYKAALKISANRMEKDMKYFGMERVTKHAIAHKIAELRLAGENNLYTIILERLLSRGGPSMRRLPRGSYVYFLED